MVESTNLEENGKGVAEHGNVGDLCCDRLLKTRTCILEKVFESSLNGMLKFPFSERFPLPTIVNCIVECSKEFYWNTYCIEASWKALFSLHCIGERSLYKNKDELHSFKKTHK